jgi:hypothetical protein
MEFDRHGDPILIDDQDIFTYPAKETTMTNHPMHTAGDKHVSDATLLAWAREQTWSDFCRDVYRMEGPRGPLSPRQHAALERMWRKDTAAAPKIEVPVNAAQNAALEGFEGIEAILARTAAAGKKWPALRFITDGGRKVTLSLMTQGKNTGKTKVEIDDIWAGYISGGRWTPTNNTRSLLPEVKRDIWALMKTIKADAEAAAVAYGRATASCSCCGRTLTDPKSVDLGIGPVCRSRAFG